MKTQENVKRVLE